MPSFRPVGKLVSGCAVAGAEGVGLAFESVVFMGAVYVLADEGEVTAPRLLTSSGAHPFAIVSNLQTNI
jgi:hypothetical protein